MKAENVKKHILQAIQPSSLQFNHQIFFHSIKTFSGRKKNLKTTTIKFGQ
jgi:hypothetical protein